MILPILKWLIDSLKLTHICNKCWSLPSEWDIDVLSIKNETAIIWITCHKCGHNVSVKAEVTKPSEMKKNFDNNNISNIIKKEHLDIKSLKEELDGTSSIEDLLF